ncbi:glycoside hydrolase family 2 protein [Massilia sp. Se16.2.3]|uniref:glycoside hydrolase family 2 protein n=1 Tax=Massilia sp. Se16.2.3 TaxID=2709303 RepID=UPI0015FF5595|nr:sugar-binding domain-containing protein [Massilia sp. Se16.2.3]QNA98350.1 glycoside hydrolase family 2 [Massilia sp. Se16.2.3]
MRSNDSPSAPYPRPQMVRQEWSSLDGWWEFAFDDGDHGLAQRWFDGRTLPERILVPFPYQSQASGIGSREIHEIMWYSRGFALPEDWDSGALLLHFGAVDYRADVWVNGRVAGRNRGGHVPFSFDIAPHLRPGSNRVTLRVEDRQDPYQPRGKQSASGTPVRIYYYCTSGIWQNVWLEPVAPLRIDHLRVLEAHPDGRLALAVQVHGPAGEWEAELDVLESPDCARLVTGTRSTSNGASLELRLQIPDPKAWSPASPHLYGLRVRLLRRGELVDTVESYAGLRSIELKDGQFHLNGKRCFLLMALDQGYWPDTLLAAPSDDALREDVAWAKRFGFNGVRKHQKIEHERWLYWCDRLGLMVWEEMPNARSWSEASEEHLEAEWLRAVMRDANHPSIVAWVPVVESFGFPELVRHPHQHDFLERMVARTRLVDTTRPVIDNDGWQHTDVTDICTIHDYSHPVEKLLERYAGTLQTGLPPDATWVKGRRLFLEGTQYRGQPIVFSEVGGYLLVPEGPERRRDRLYDQYGNVRNEDELAQRYRTLMEGLASLPFLAGLCYTQLTDVEHEQNGLLSAQRVPRLPPEQLADLHRRLWPDG